MTQTRQVTSLDYANGASKWRLIRTLRPANRRFWLAAVFMIVTGYAVDLMLARLRIPRCGGVNPNARCEASLRSVGYQLYLFAQNPAGRFPDRWGELVARGLCKVEDLACTSHRAGDSCGLKYVLIPGQGVFDDPSNVLAYDPCSHPYSTGLLVLFLDGHVDRLSPGKLKEQLSATRRRLATQSRNQQAE